MTFVFFGAKEGHFTIGTRGIKDPFFNVCAAWNNDSDVKTHVPIETLFAAIMLKSHASFYSEWSSVGV